MFELWGRGVLIGFAIAAPVGPIGVLCIRRTLNDGRWHGLLSGLGAASADACYGAVAALGLTAISNLLVQQQSALGLFGGLFLLYLGIGTFCTEPTAQEDVSQQNSTGLFGVYLSTFLLTLTNPATILSFVGIFAGVGIASVDGNYLAAGLLVAGVFTGSAAWWLILSGGVSLFRDRFNRRWMLWINRLSGTIIITFGCGAIGSLWF